MRLCFRAAMQKDGYATVVFRVKDNGIGMSREFRKHVFDSFSREHTVTENGIGGTGLGMAITKKHCGHDGRYNSG